MIDRVLVDAGPLVAIFSDRDQHHEACTGAVPQIRPPLLTCWPIITEVAYILRGDFAAVAKLFDFFEAGVVKLLPLEQREMPELLSIMKRYRSLEAQLADAALVYLAEREGIKTIFTLDRRDFSVYRTHGNRSFTIVP